MKHPIARATLTALALSFAVAACTDEETTPVGPTTPQAPGAPASVSAVANGTTVTVSFSAGYGGH